MSSTAVEFRVLLLGVIIVSVLGTGTTAAVGMPADPVTAGSQASGAIDGPPAPTLSAPAAGPAVAVDPPAPQAPPPAPQAPPPAPQAPSAPEVEHSHQAPPSPLPPPAPAVEHRHQIAAPPPPRQTAAAPEAPAAAPSPTGPTGWRALDEAIARIPGYDGSASWSVSTSQGNWGVADWYDQSVTISRSTPDRSLDSVVRHEWSHLLSVRPYDEVAQAVESMNAWYGGDGLMGAERAADCMARRLGAGWTHYTDCQDARWRDGARRLLAGQRLS